MGLEVQFTQGGFWVDRCDVRRALSLIKAQKDGDQPFDNGCITVPPDAQVARFSGIEDQPYLAGTTANARVFRPLLLGQRGQLSTKIDDVAIALVPILKERHVIFDRLEIR